MNTKIEQLDEYRLTISEFEELDELDRILVSVTCFAASEINLFAKFYLFSSPDFCDEPLLDSMIASQKMSILRNWSAKLFELHEFAKDFQKQSGGSTSGREAVEEFLAGFENQVDQVGLSLARDLRNEVTSHFPIKAAKKNLRHLSERANLSLLLHHKDGNSSFPLGEEVLFAGRLNRFSFGKPDDEGGHRALERWYQFNLDATRLARIFHHAVIVPLVFNRFPEKFARQKTFWVKDEISKGHREVCVPLFLRTT